ncbi:hypothetical protein AAFN86_18400 [Roseomonas sp. CAU 1739]|uniref:hypothetical protein n=1 Tax=Roseomonas sp. CAU 1739 TaxID=3140364 RepID=UPI00325AC0FB
MTARPAALLALSLLPALLLGATEQASTDTIISDCGGGVTGGGGGTCIEVDGTAALLRRPRAGAPAEETRLDVPAPYARIAALLDSAGFVRMPRGAPSNMTCSITWLRDGQSHVVTWGIGRAPAARQPAWREIETLSG